MSPTHSAKLCILQVFNTWSDSILNGNCSTVWSLFDTNLTPIPKPKSQDLSTLKAWRPISIGTSENWILEKIFAVRLKPYMSTDDSQFGYKEGHSSSHAIELVRTVERTSDTHVCLLDASSAFDKLSWYRVRDQFLKRNIPLILSKLVLKQLVSNRISVCLTDFIYPQAGTKQGGVLSGYIFAMCYDDLVVKLTMTSSGILICCVQNEYMFLCVIIYADDILLMARSPWGLKLLIDETFKFAALYNDLTFNPSKSCILRLGPHRKPAVSIYNIPTAESYIYLGVEIGRAAKPQLKAAASLYSKSNIMMSQNKELHLCSNEVKNNAINTYGNVYAIETFTKVESKLRAAHRHMTRATHTGWRQFADLPGPNITNHRLYTAFHLSSLSEIHRHRRNNFLISAESSPNRIIRNIIGNLPRITV